MQKTEYIATERQYGVDISMLSEKLQLAYDIIVNHQNTAVPKEQLLLIINGEGRTRGGSKIFRTSVKKKSDWAWSAQGVVDAEGG